MDAMEASVEKDKISEEDFNFQEEKKPLKDRIREWVLNSKGFLLFAVIFLISVSVIAEVVWKDLDWKGWFTLFVVMFVVLGLLKEVCPAEFIMLSANALLMVTKIILPEQSTKGFANTGVCTVAIMFLIAQGIQTTGALEFLIRYFLKRPKNLFDAHLRLMVPVMSISGFMNNTPLVAMMIPVVQSWSKKVGFAPSKLMIPLSYAAILGGTTTLIGTSTNLIVEGLAKDEEPDFTVNMFEIFLVGGPCCVIGLIYVVLASHKLLPESGGDGVEEYTKNPREYSVSVKVKPGAFIVGRSIEEAGLRHLKGLFLVEIQRNTEIIPAPSPDTVLLAEDILTFAGVVTKVKDLWKIEGLIPATDQIDKVTDKRRKRCLIECVVAIGSTLANHSVRESKFRTRYNAAILSVHRGGKHIDGLIGDIVLLPGDTMLLEAGPGFIQRFKESMDFALVSPVHDSKPFVQNRLKAATAVVLLVTMIIINSCEVLDIYACAMACAMLMLVCGCLSIQEARDSIEGGILVTIAAAFGIAEALKDTGIADHISQSIVDIFEPTGSAGILAGLYIAVIILNALISNGACVTLMFPIAYELVGKTDLKLRAVVFLLMMAGSADFSTPIGYQTNMMVYGPGGYKFMDYVKFGLPLQVLVGVATVGICHAIWN